MASSGDALPGLLAQTDLAFPWAIRVAATLRLADLIARGVVHLQELAAESGVNADALKRLLRYLIKRKMFAEPAPGVFALTDTARLLLEDHPQQLRTWFDQEGVGGRMDALWAGLLDAVRTGEAAYPQLHGRTFWEDLADNPDLSTSFNTLMAGQASAGGDALVTDYNWAGVHHVIDIGGGTGKLLTSILKAHPSMRGTLLDEPATALQARKALLDSGLADRCNVIAGSFFDPLPAGGDVYVLSYILHDWGDQEALMILRRCAEAAGPSGRVLLREWVIDRVGAQHFVTQQDLFMLLLLGGRERTLEEFSELARASDMILKSARHLSSGQMLLECAAR